MWGPRGLSWAYAGLLGAMFDALGKHAAFHALSEYPRCAPKIGQARSQDGQGQSRMVVAVRFCSMRGGR